MTASPSPAADDSPAGSAGPSAAQGPAPKLKIDRPRSRLHMRHRFDLALYEDKSAYCLAALIGVFAFLACLAFGTALALDHYAREVGGAGAGHLTIELAPPEDQDAGSAAAILNSRVDATMQILHASSIVTSAAVLTDTQIAALLQPWLGDLSTLKTNLPLPRLIDVTLSPDAVLLQGDEPQHIDRLRAALTAAVPGLSIDEHAALLKRTARLTENLSLLALCSGGLIGFAVVIAIIFLVQSSLAIHHKTITLLHVIGASDGYIARQFSLFAGHLALIGTGVGTAVAGAVGIILALSLPAGWLFSVLDWHWLALPLLPLIFVGLSRLVALSSVFLLLRRLP